MFPWQPPLGCVLGLVEQPHSHVAPPLIQDQVDLVHDDQARSVICHHGVSAASMHDQLCGNGRNSEGGVGVVLIWGFHANQISKLK